MTRNFPFTATAMEKCGAPMPRQALLAPGQGSRKGVGPEGACGQRCAASCPQEEAPPGGAELIRPVAGGG